jgi:hypothetical protein
MRTQLSLLSAAALAVAGLCIPAIAADDSTINPTTPGSTPGSFNAGADASISLPSGPAVSNSDATAIRTLMGQVTDDALSPNGTKDLCSQFCKSDCDRLTKQDVKSDDIAAVANQIRQDWRAKYQDDFRVKDESVVYNDSFRIIQGDLSDQARTAGERITPGTDLNGGASGATSTPPSAGRTSSASGSTNLPATPGTGTDNRNGSISAARTLPPAAGATTQPSEASADTATVIIPASHGMPMVAVPVRNEGTISKQWKLVAAPNCDCQRLHDDLLKQLTAIRDDKANWPADQNDAYRMVSHHVLAAVTDTGDTGLGAPLARPAGSTEYPSNTMTTPPDAAK